MKWASGFLALLFVFSVGCSTTDGPRPPKSGLNFQKRDVNALVDCEAQYPDQDGIMDPLVGYFAYVGPDAENVRQCLVTEHGWFELGPPEWPQGTMAPPR